MVAGVMAAAWQAVMLPTGAGSGGLAGSGVASWAWKVNPPLVAAMMSFYIAHVFDDRGGY
jgi:hypothetical protein